MCAQASSYDNCQHSELDLKLLAWHLGPAFDSVNSTYALFVTPSRNASYDRGKRRGGDGDGGGGGGGDGAAWIFVCCMVLGRRNFPRWGTWEVYIKVLIASSPKLPCRFFSFPTVPWYVGI